MKDENKVDDLQLFARIADGDEIAFRQIFHSYNKMIFPFVAALVKSEMDAREIMQEVFLKLWLNRDKLDAVKNPRGWLQTVAANAAYDFLRKSASYELMLIRSASFQPGADEEFRKDMNAKQARDVVNQAVRKLPFRRRQIFQMNRIEGYSRKEIADRLGISENTVRNQLADAVEFVENYLRKNSIVLFIAILPAAII